MSQAESAISRHAHAAGTRHPADERHDTTQDSSAATPRRSWSLKQEARAREFVAAYGISYEDIIFFDDTDTPFFLFEALAQIINALADFTSLSVTKPDLDEGKGIVTCEAEITSEHSRLFKSFGAAIIGEPLPGQAVADLSKALDLARARALRSALRLAGFDVVRAHEQSKQQGAQNEAPRPSPEAEQRNRELAEIHIIAEEANLIVGDDKTAYYKQLSVFFPHVSTAGDLNAKERTQFIAILRAIKAAREVRSTAS
jgi:hypothetical protein